MSIKVILFITVQIVLGGRLQDIHTDTGEWDKSLLIIIILVLLSLLWDIQTITVNHMHI